MLSLTANEYHQLWFSISFPIHYHFAYGNMWYRSLLSRMPYFQFIHSDSQWNSSLKALLFFFFSFFLFLSFNFTMSNAYIFRTFLLFIKEFQFSASNFIYVIFSFEIMSFNKLRSIYKHKQKNTSVFIWKWSTEKRKRELLIYDYVKCISVYVTFVVCFWNRTAVTVCYLMITVRKLNRY